jgi:TatA/E family protein of Tat protein translocase
MFGLGTPEIIGILVLLLLLFGAKRLPELARSLGSGVKEFRKSVKEISEDIHDDKESSSKSSWCNVRRAIMACPHLSKVTGECLLQQVPEEDKADDLAVVEPIRHEWCLSAGKDYRQCPVFQELLLDLVAWRRQKGNPSPSP